MTRLAIISLVALTACHEPTGRTNSGAMSDAHPMSFLGTHGLHAAGASGRDAPTNPDIGYPISPNIITGTDGPDTLIGSPGNDLISGGAGDDVICGGPCDPALLDRIGGW